MIVWRGREARVGPQAMVRLELAKGAQVLK